MKLSKYTFIYIELILFFVINFFYTIKSITTNMFLFILFSLAFFLLIDFINKKLIFKIPILSTIVFDFLLILLLVNSFFANNISYEYIMIFIMLYIIKVFFVKENKIMSPKKNDTENHI